MTFPDFKTIKKKCEATPFEPLPDPESLLGIRFAIKEEYEGKCICSYTPPTGIARCDVCQMNLKA